MIKYELSEADLAAFNIYYRKHLAPFAFRVSRYYIIIIVVIMLIGLKDTLLSREYWRNADVLSFLPFIFLAVVFLFVGRKGFGVNRAVKRYAKNNPHLFGPVEITLTEDKLISQGVNTKSEFNFNSFIGYIESDDYYFLMRSKQNALIIPKKAISDKQDETIIRTKIKAYTK
jgi:hypothetical protein